MPHELILLERPEATRAASVLSAALRVPGVDRPLLARAIEGEVATPVVVLSTWDRRAVVAGLEELRRAGADVASVFARESLADRMLRRLSAPGPVPDESLRDGGQAIRSDAWWMALVPRSRVALALASVGAALLLALIGLSFLGSGLEREGPELPTNAWSCLRRPPTRSRCRAWASPQERAAAR